MKQLTNKEHLVYMLEKSHLVTALPFVDQQLDNQIPKSKVSYLIMTEQAEMQKDPQEYIKNLQLPQLRFANTEEFEKEVERVNKKLAEKQTGQAKKKESSYPEVPKKIVANDQQKYLGQVKKGIVTYQNSVTKHLNLELYKKYGPLVLKELIEVVERERANLQQAIHKEKQALQELNKNRKYEQVQTLQRQNDIGERVKIMLNKRRKVE